MRGYIRTLPAVCALQQATPAAARPRQQQTRATSNIAYKANTLYDSADAPPATNNNGTGGAAHEAGVSVANPMYGGSGGSGGEGAAVYVVLAAC